MNECWRPVVGYEGLYEVSDAGRVRRLERRVKHITGYRVLKPRILVPSTQKSGHLYFKSFGGRGGELKWVHRLVYEAFIGSVPIGKEVRHLDGNPENNRPENLAIGSRAENAHDTYQYGGKYKKLYKDDVLEIRARLATGERQQDIAKDYRVSQATISDIHTKKTFNYF